MGAAPAYLVRLGSGPDAGLTPVDEVVAHITAGIEPVPDEVVPVGAAFNRILGQEVTAAWDLPRFDNAAMDGFAVHAADCLGASAARPAVLWLGEPSYAGHARREMLVSGEASAIGTGAALPPGADAVVRRERARLRGPRVEILHEAMPAEDVRRRGEDAPAGTTLLPAGIAIGPGQLAAMTGAGCERVAVRRRPRVVVMLTGDEVATIGQRLRADQVPDAIGPALLALLIDAGCEASIIGPIPDQPTLLRRVLSQITADVIVSVGGVSAGDRDLLAGVAAELGESTSWRVALRPGSPFLSARIGALPLLGLPGNPAAALVGYEVFVRSVVRRLLGVPVISGSLQAVLTADIIQRPGRLHYVRGCARAEADGLHVTPLHPHGSGSISSLSEANVWIVLAPRVTVAESGSLVDVVPIWSGWLAGGHRPHAGVNSPR